MSHNKKKAKEANLAYVLVHLPTDQSYHFALAKSLEPAVKLMPDEGRVEYLYMGYKNIVGARNMAVKRALDGNFTHLMFLDSDMEFAPATLARLLQHNKDIVGGLYMRKMYPHIPLCFSRGEKRGEDTYDLHPFMPPRRLTECESIATGCMLVNTNVFKQMSPPWFLYEQSWNDPLTTTTEDITFCRHARAKGIQIYVDGSLHAVHIGDCRIMPNFTNTNVTVETFGGNR